MSKTYDDIDINRYKKLEEILYEVAEELMANNFSKEAIYTFLHKSVDLSIYRAECRTVLGGE